QQPSLLEMTRKRGYRSLVVVPLMRDGAPIGLINVTRRETGRFADHHIKLLQTFADQAVIAIENVRLFNETKEALERQTATADVLKVISRSTVGSKPKLEATLETLLESAIRLCSATRGHIFRYDGEVLRFVAASGALPAFRDWLQSHPSIPGSESVL